jgi:hypothetical protein
VEHIALNDEPSDLDAENVAGYISTGLLADLFGKETDDVARDIVRFRERNVERHNIRWYVYLDASTLVPREAGMRGAWPSEAKCSCGWETNTGGAVRSWIENAIREHRFDVQHGIGG